MRRARNVAAAAAVGAAGSLNDLRWGMRSRFRAALAAPVVAAAAAAVAVSLSADTTVASNAAPTIPTPQSAFGFTPCQDYKLANYTQISSYFHQLDNASDRMQVVSLGQTSEGRDQVMGIVSAPENLSPANLAKYQDIANRLAHARDLTDDQAHDLAKQGRRSPGSTSASTRPRSVRRRRRRSSRTTC